LCYNIKENNELKKTEKIPTMKRKYILTRNRWSIYGPGGAEYSTRKEAFEGAVLCAGMRLTSGIPTRKPYIITIQEYDEKYLKTHAWEVRLEIENITSIMRHCHCFMKEEHCTCNESDPVRDNVSQKSNDDHSEEGDN
jgi:hypothetical protein